MEKLKRNFAAEIRGIDNEPVTLGVTAEGLLKCIGTLPDALRAEVEAHIRTHLVKTLTLREAAVMSLTANHADEGPSLRAEDRVRRYDLALRIARGAATITPEERDLIKLLIGKNFPGCLVAPVCWRLLEGVDPQGVRDE